MRIKLKGKADWRMKDACAASWHITRPAALGHIQLQVRQPGSTASVGELDMSVLTSVGQRVGRFRDWVSIYVDMDQMGVRQRRILGAKKRCPCEALMAAHSA